MSKYTNCTFFDEDQASKCGAIKGNELILLSAPELTAYINKKGVARNAITEIQLIYNRAKWLKLKCDERKKEICGAHRSYLGLDWKSGVKCLYPGHTGNVNATEGSVSWAVYQEIIKEYTDFPILGSVCKVCRRNIYEKSSTPHFVEIRSKRLSRAIEVEACDDVDSIFTDKISSSGESSDELFEGPASASISNTELESRTKLFREICKSFEVEPPHIVNSTIENVQRKLTPTYNTFVEMHTKLTDIFCKAIAPGQESQLKEFFDKKAKSDEVQPDNSELEDDINTYNNCVTSDAKFCLLTLVCKKYTTDQLCSSFAVSPYEVKLARAVYDEQGISTRPKRADRVCKPYKEDKGQHFLNFLMSGSLLQEEAYGVTTIKFDNGVKKVVSNSMLMCLKQHAIKSYQNYCTDIGYPSLSERSLRYLLDMMQPKIRRRLSGADNYLVHGYDAFEVIFLLLLTNFKIQAPKFHFRLYKNLPTLYRIYIQEKTSAKD